MVGGRSLAGPTNVGVPGTMVQGNASNDFQVNCTYPGPTAEWNIQVAWTPIGSSSHTIQGCGSIPGTPESTWVSKDHWAYARSNLDHAPGPLQTATKNAMETVEKLAAPCASPTPSVSVRPRTTPSPARPTIPSSPASPTIPSRDTPRGQPLCAEAIKHFGITLRQAGVSNTKVTRLRTNRTEILAGFAAVITAYNAAHPQRPARSPRSSMRATMGALDWLAEPGGLSSKVEKGDLVENAPATNYVTRTERRLADRIVASTHPLSPAEVFALSLDLSKGNVTHAMLAAHNTLRALGRVDVVNQVMVDVLPDRTVYGKNLAYLRSGAENSGPWYHLFGTAYFELMSTATGEGSEAAQALALGTDTAPPGISALSTKALVTAARHFDGQVPTVSKLSRFANWLEQKVRKRNGSKLDAEKYCINVWGAQLGAVLAHLMGAEATYEATFDDDISNTEIFTYASPFSMRWTTPQGTTTINQKTGEVSFGTPLLIYPLAEGSTWGAAIVPPADTSGTVTFVATKAGAELHVLRVNTVLEEAVFYLATARSAGEEMTLPLGDAAFGQAMTTSSGTSITAQRLSLATPVPSVNRTAEDSWLPQILGGTLAVMVLLGVGSAVMLHRLRARRARR
jgi:hypothetical protein